MIIIGAKGFAKEVLEVLNQLDYKNEIYFFDNVSTEIGEELFGYKILKTDEEVLEIFKTDNQFTLGLGSPKYRRLLTEKFESFGGKLTGILSPYARIGHFDNEIGEGVSIMTGTVLTNSIKVGKGALINLNCTVGHDSIIGNFAELSPGVHISGNCEIGENSILGSGCVILPKVKIGSNSTVGAGSVVTKDVPDGVTVVGVPGRTVG